MDTIVLSVIIGLLSGYFVYRIWLKSITKPSNWYKCALCNAPALALMKRPPGSIITCNNPRCIKEVKGLTRYGKSKKI